MANGHKNLAQQISTSWTNFGILLLEDDNGGHTEAIVKERREKAEDINTEIFRQWVNGKGRKPVSWATLVDVLRKIDMNKLADDIQQVKYPVRIII
jgi:hypothetical protein